MGEKPLAEDCLRDLLQRNCEILGVCTREKDAGLWWGKNRIKDIAYENEIPILKRSEVEKLKPDLLLSVLYPFIVEESVIASAGKAFNLHLAPLPEYKGCNGGSHALMRGDKRFGVTLHEMTAALDRGRIVEKRYFSLSLEDTSKSLYQKAVKTGGEVWRDQIENILRGNPPCEDIEDDGSQPNPRSSLDCKLIPTQSPRETIYDFVRALDFEPHEPAYFMIHGEKFYLRQNDFDLRTFKLKSLALEEKFSFYLSHPEIQQKGLGANHHE
jgi:methionyl-tRNA formyltransferase